MAGTKAKEQGELEFCISLDEATKEQFHIGFDWTFRKEDGKPFLLEYQMCPGGRDNFIPAGPVSNFLTIGASKIHQHQLISELMPECVTERIKFGPFIKNHKKVVYKGENGSEGNSVSIFIPSKDWKADLVEEFIEPCTVKKNGNQHAFVVRDTWLLAVKRKSHTASRISAKRIETIAKVSKEPIDVSDPQKAFNLTCHREFGCSSANAESVPVDKLELVDSLSTQALRALIRRGNEAEWNPRNFFERAIVGYWCKSDIFMRVPTKVTPLAINLKEKGTKVFWQYFFGDLESAAKLAPYYDAILLQSEFSEHDDRGVVFMTLVRRERNAITSDVLPSWYRIPSPKPNVLIDNEFSVPQTAAKIIKFYQMRGENQILIKPVLCKN